MEFSQRLFPELDHGSTKELNEAYRRLSASPIARRALELERLSSITEWGVTPSQGSSGLVSSEALQVTVSTRRSLAAYPSEQRLDALRESAHVASKALRLGRVSSQGAAARAVGDDSRLVALEERVAHLLTASSKMDTQLALLCKHFHLSCDSTDSAGPAKRPEEVKVPTDTAATSRGL